MDGYTEPHNVGYSDSTGTNCETLCFDIDINRMNKLSSYNEV